MIGLLVIGSFAGMCVLRATANLIMRRDDQQAARRQVEQSARALAEEAEAWLDQRRPGPV